MTICKQKLPASVRKRWEGKLAEHGQQEDDLNALLQFMESCLEVEECLSEGKVRERGREKNDNSRKELLTTTAALQSSIVNQQNCTLCQGRHKITELFGILAMNAKSRWRFVKTARLCFIRLHIGHSAANCKEQSTGNKGCHELLRGKTQSIGGRETRRTANENTLQVGVAKASCNALIGLQIAVAKAHGPSGLTCKVTCLLDAGSQRTFMRNDLADRLCLSGPQENNLKLADQFPRDQAEVDVLIGLDHYYEFVGTEHRRRRKDEPIAARSVLECYQQLFGLEELRKSRDVKLYESAHTVNSALKPDLDRNMKMRKEDSGGVFCFEPPSLFFHRTECVITGLHSFLMTRTALLYGQQTTCIHLKVPLLRVHKTFTVIRGHSWNASPADTEVLLYFGVPEPCMDSGMTIR
ncbi:hypothetical protein M513_12972 [Trichuris suis]|uniref:Peptidase aspartic putative domain-containing protein n=1 Tax=Trichuris suis TaxID=68888 RepID=A0A085LMG8_9BILA|nr:hypothetical protein M513_12972 [Trichuris suis]